MTLMSFKSHLQSHIELLLEDSFIIAVGLHVVNTEPMSIMTNKRIQRSLRLLLISSWQMEMISDYLSEAVTTSCTISIGLYNTTCFRIIHLHVCVTEWLRRAVSVGILLLKMLALYSN